MSQTNSSRLYTEKSKESIITEFDEMMLDLEFIFDLRTHINGILNQYHEAMAPFGGLSHLFDCEKRPS